MIHVADYDAADNEKHIYSRRSNHDSREVGAESGQRMMHHNGCRSQEPQGLQGL